MAKKPYAHWDPAINADWHVRQGDGPLVLDSEQSFSKLSLLARKARREDRFGDPVVDYLQTVKALAGAPPHAGLRVQSFQYMPQGMTFFGADPIHGEPYPISDCDVTPPPYSSFQPYIHMGYSLSLRGYVGSAVGSGYAADVKVQWADAVSRLAGSGRGGYTGLIVKSLNHIPELPPFTAHAFSVLHGKRPHDTDWIYIPQLWSRSPASPPWVTIPANGLSDDLIRVVVGGGTMSPYSMHRWDGAAWVELYSSSTNLTVFWPPFGDFRNFIFLTADLFAGSALVQPGSPGVWPDAETWFQRIELSQFEPWVLDKSEWGYREWEDHWSWLVAPSNPQYFIERRRPVMDMLHKTPGIRGGPTILRTSDEDLGVCVEFNDKTYLQALDPHDLSGYDLTQITTPVVMDDVMYGHQAPFAMLGRFKFTDMDQWSRTLPCYIMAAGLPWTSATPGWTGIGICWKYGGGIADGKLCLRAWDDNLGLWVELEYQFNGSDWADRPIDLGFAWSGARGDIAGRPLYELRLVVNGLTVASVINPSIRVRNSYQITIGNGGIGLLGTTNAIGFIGMFREAMVFADPMSDADMREAWHDSSGLDNPSFEVPATRPGEALSWAWRSVQAVGGWASFNDYLPELEEWATAYEMFDAGFFQPHVWEYENEADRLAAVGFTADDVGLLAWQRDTNTIWQLTSDSPITWLNLELETNESWIAAFAVLLSTVFNLGSLVYESLSELFAIWDFSAEHGGPPGTIISTPWLQSYNLVSPAEDNLGPLGKPTGFHGWLDIITGLMDYPIEVEEFGEAWSTDPLSTATGSIWIPGSAVDGVLRGRPLTFPLKVVTDRRFLVVYTDDSMVVLLELTTGEYADAPALSAMLEAKWVAAVGPGTGVRFSNWTDGVDSGLTFGWDGGPWTFISWSSMFGVRRSVVNNDARRDLGFVFSEHDNFGRVAMPAAEVMTVPTGTVADEMFLLDQWSFLLFDTMIDPYMSGMFALDYQAEPAVFGMFDGTPDPTIIERYTLVGWFGTGAVWVPSLPDNPPVPGGPWALFDSGTHKWELFEDTLWPDNLYP